MSTLPQDIENAAKKADEIIESLNTPTEEVVETDDAPIQDLSVDEDFEAVALETDGNEDEPTEPTAPTEPDLAEELATAQHKYAVLQGKYNTEIPALQQQVRQMQLQVDRDANTVPPVEAAPSINPKDYEEYGEEFVKLAQTLEQTLARNKSLEEKVASLSTDSQTIAETQQASNVKVFYAELGRLAPAWEKLNADPNFIKWLGETGGDLSGKTRQEHLNEATYNGDAVRVAKIFNIFNDKFYQKDPGKQPKLPSRESQATPKTSASQPTQKEKDIIWSTQSIKDFYRDRKLGKFNNDPSVADKLERDLFAAQSEGRIQA